MTIKLSYVSNDRLELKKVLTKNTRHKQLNCY